MKTTRFSTQTELLKCELKTNGSIYYVIGDNQEFLLEVNKLTFKRGVKWVRIFL